MVRRILFTLLAVFTAALLVTLFTRLSPLSDQYLPNMRKVLSSSGKESATMTTPFPPSCARDNDTSNPLTALDAKYAHLMDEKFTYVAINPPYGCRHVQDDVANFEITESLFRPTSAPKNLVRR